MNEANPRDDDAEVDDFLRELESVEELSLVAASLPGAPVPERLRARVLDSARAEGRFAHFAAQAAELLDVSPEAALALLDRLSDPTVFEPGFSPDVDICHVEGGPRVQRAITGFVRVRAGGLIPNHEHLGPEQVLMLQGRCVDDTGRLLGPGDVVSMPAGSNHSFEVRPGPDLVYLAVVEVGLRVGDQVLYPADPRV